MTAELYFAWCADDPTAPESDMPILEDAMKAAGIDYTIDFLTEAVHGFAPAGPALPPRGVGAALGAGPRPPAAQPLTPYARVASSSTATPLRRL